MHVWAVNAKGHVVRDWPVSGRPGWPKEGTYHVFSKALWSRSSIADVGFRWMVRFAHGHTTSIGFHNIPYDSAGRPIQTHKQLGHPVRGGGCVRSADKDARWLYAWAGIGTTVVVIGG
jgi:lipoprotein-anchoring transpeptidase ErfK/SrfK